MQDEVLAQSDLLTPGNELKTLNLLSGAEKKLTAGGYEGKLVAYYYDRETGEKSNLSTVIPVKVVGDELTTWALEKQKRPCIMISL